jgi:hypothetical protein
MSDFSSSIKEIFNERISSPFYGSLIVSWLLWNWEIPYVTFFVDQDKLGTIQNTVNGVASTVYLTNKIDYIFANCNNIWFLLVFPIFSTALILLVLPYLTNGAYWVTLRFDTWRNNKKNEVEGKRLITVEESLQLRMEIQNQEENYNKLFIKKDKEIQILKDQLQEALKNPVWEDEIKTLKEQLQLAYNDTSKDATIETLQDQLKESLKEIEKEKEKMNHPEEIQIQNDLKKFLANSRFNKYIPEIAERLKTRNTLPSFNPDVINYYKAYELIEPEGQYNYNITQKGKLFLREFIKQKLDPL